MKHRTIIAATLALALPVAGIAGDTGTSGDTETASETETLFTAGTVEYTDGLVAQALADGKTVFIEYNTVWCTTCAAQKRTMAALKAENPGYEEHITFVRVDYDDWGRAPVSTDRGVFRRSTLIAENAEGEIGRVIAQTASADIKALMDAALAAAIASMPMDDDMSEPAEDAATAEG